ncbi:MAG: AAA family ATPase [Candidatus Competibacter sp.]|nr:AAA family ATPase [Candidatus Competibacter sp.]
MVQVNLDSPRLAQGNRAPWLALPALGLLIDENLFGPDHVSKRLALNLATVQQVKTLRASDLRGRARRRYQNPTRQAEMTDAVAAVEAYRDAIHRGVEGTLDLAKALVVDRPPKDEPEEDETPPTPGPTPGPNPIEPPSLAGESSDALLEGRDEDLAAIADAIDEAWTAFEEAPADDIEIPVTLPSNQREVTGTTTVNCKVLDWVQAFCSQENWGGFLDTSETFLPIALASAADPSPVFIRPDRIVTIEGEELSPVPDRVPTTAQPTAPSNPTTEQIWPPPVNALGMIGQYQAVDLLVKQALFSKATGQRFFDKLLVGLAGVGKSTLARNIGALLLNQEPLFFSGSDLHRPGDLLERLAQEGLLPAAPGTGTVRVESCLIFIDEVHGISASVATALLSAMDDRRITSIEGGLYDFSQVVFLLATTDQGKLSEAFQSRPNKTWLRSYTLHELAGIVWLHGKGCLDGAELSREACYEIAARARCNPRRSVRDLSEALRPHFFHCATQQMDGIPSLQQAAALMTPENIAAFYESQGIDYKGLDDVARRFLLCLKQHGAVSEATLSQALGLTHRQDFVETAEYLVRLGLIETSPAGRSLTREGRQYSSASSPPDLRHRISRAM